VGSGGELVSGRELVLGALRILPVATSHDAREPVAMVVDDGTHRVAVCTDTGVFTTLLQQRLVGCDLLLLEANHDADMLRHGPYPWPLKQRISSRRGHLGNHQTLDAIAAIRGPGLRGVVGLHLSEQNNRPELVVEMLRQAAGADLPVGVVTRYDMLGLELAGEGVVLDRRPVPPSRRSRTASRSDGC
jgi:phosphoribosyl 1,2-cyclic phosphodiesterase